MDATKDTRVEHGTECYCDECCDTAEDWYVWRSEDGQRASGPRYWTVEHALADEEMARADGLPVLWHEGLGIPSARVRRGVDKREQPPVE